MAVSAISSALAGIQLPTLPSQPSPAGSAPLAGVGDAARIGDGLPATDGAAGGFGEVLVKALDNVNQTQATADRLAVDAATGNLTNVHDYMIAATEASLATELTVAVRNKAVEAFNTIMSMGV